MAKRKYETIAVGLLPGQLQALKAIGIKDQRSIPWLIRSFVQIGLTDYEKPNKVQSLDENK